jgi:hypothetical protein
MEIAETRQIRKFEIPVPRIARTTYFATGSGEVSVRKRRNRPTEQTSGGGIRNQRADQAYLWQYSRPGEPVVFDFRKDFSLHIRYTF